MFCMTAGCEFSIKLNNSASNFLMSSTGISSVKPLIADQMISTCFSTSIGWYCGCFKISVSRWPRASWACVALSRSDPNCANAASSRYCARSRRKLPATCFKAMKQVAGSLRLDLAQYRELAAFAQFGSDLDKATQAQLARGQRLTEILKQPQYQPMDVEKQVLIIWSAINGFTDDIPVEDIKKFEAELLSFIENSHPAVMQNIREKKAITDEIQKDLEQSLKDFKDRWAESARAAAA